MRISDMITEFINLALDESDGAIELQRADVANQFGCVPSQINYVISTRFSPEHGYAVESRRGGGGYIRIRKIYAGKKFLLAHAINSVGDEIDTGSAFAILANLREADILSDRDVDIISAALSDRSMADLSHKSRARLRATVLKRTLSVCSPKEK